MSKILLYSFLLLLVPNTNRCQILIDTDTLHHKLYPAENTDTVDLPSPFLTPDGREFVVALTSEGGYAIIPVTLSNERRICHQLIVDSLDFPSLATTGLHEEQQLVRLDSVTGRSLTEITALAQPGSLSTSGFLAAGEDIRSVLIADNRVVKKMQLNHPVLAKSLFHVLNLMDEDLKLDRWNMAHHEWEHITGFWYNNKFISVRAFDTKGGQRSIFDDGIMGAFHIQLWRELSSQEITLLQKEYAHLPGDRFQKMLDHLSQIDIGEMQPQYIMRYGFYEGHTFWRADPLATALIFGWIELDQLMQLFPASLDKYLLDPFPSY
jgi:hypothetical protein